MNSVRPNRLLRAVLLLAAVAAVIVLTYIKHRAAGSALSRATEQSAEAIGDGTAPQLDATAGWDLFRDDETGLTFRYPGELLGPPSITSAGAEKQIRLPYRASAGVDTCQLPDGTAYRWGLQITIFRDEGGDTSFSAAVGALPKNGRYQPVKVAGRPAYRFAGQGQWGGFITLLPLSGKYYIERMNMSVGQKRGECPMDQWPEVPDPANAILFDRILSTFTWS